MQKPWILQAPSRNSGWCGAGATATQRSGFGSTVISSTAKRLVESRDFASDIPSAATDNPVATSVKSRKREASPRYEHDWRRWRTAILGSKRPLAIRQRRDLGAAPILF